MKQGGLCRIANDSVALVDESGRLHKLAQFVRQNPWLVSESMMFRQQPRHFFILHGQEKCGV
jgi:hypothetical protein